MRKSIALQSHWLSGVQAQQFIQPPFDLVVDCVPDWIGHGDFLETLESACELFALLGVAFLSDLFDEFQRQRSASAFVAVDCAAHENVMRTEESFDVGQRYGSSLVNNYQVSVTDFISICGKHVLNELRVCLFYFDSDYWLVVVFR
jgi:hypothetical protein